MENDNKNNQEEQKKIEVYYEYIKVLDAFFKKHPEIGKLYDDEMKQQGIDPKKIFR